MNSIYVESCLSILYAHTYAFIFIYEPIYTLLRSISPTSYKGIDLITGAPPVTSPKPNDLPSPTFKCQPAGGQGFIMGMG